MESEHVSRSTFHQYEEEVRSKGPMPISKRRAIAAQYLSSSVSWSWDVPRTREGFYHYDAGLAAATARAIEFTPYADLLWLETAKPDVERAASFASAIRKIHPRKVLVYNLSPSFNWMGQGFDEASLRSFIWDIAKHGYAIVVYFCISG